MHPNFCITRPNGTVTALIAVDELPSSITVGGIPRFLHQDDAHGMINVGTVGSRGQCYTLDVNMEANRPNNGELAGGGLNGETATAPALVIGADGIFYNPHAIDAAIWNPRSTAGSGMTWENGVNNNGVVASAHEEAKNDGSPPPARESRSQNSNHPKTPPKKEYCSFWIRRGECDYSQQGCLYKHEMPMDRETLGRLGLRDIPRWYRDKFKVRSLVDEKDTRSNGGRSWRHTDQVSTHSHGAARYGLHSPRANGEFADSDVPNGGLRHAQASSTISAAPNGACFGASLGANGMPILHHSLSEGNNKVNPFTNFDVLTQTQGIPSEAPIPFLNHNCVMNRHHRHSTHESLVCHASKPAVTAGIPSVPFNNITTAGANSHGMNGGFVVPSQSQSSAPGTNSVWAPMVSNDGLYSSLMSPFQTMAMGEPQKHPTTPEEHQLKKNTKARHLFQHQAIHASASNNVSPVNDASRTTNGTNGAATPVTTTTGTNNHMGGLLSTFSSPLPSPTRAPSYRSSRSAMVIEPPRGIATGENTPSTSQSSENSRYSSGNGKVNCNANKTLNPIGYNQNGENYRQRRMKQNNQENDPFGLGINDDVRRPASARR
ncbi:hypothetical protein AJ79_02497 [Helicocarpus griseus UAMH5409]|uniref:C3H1-type domain-containing protein n=1 Tax=Helicocarpus griseus UAMH5409 TaxID=1447875 RepID=A0A2B7Y2P4_9EURO|nr:hypothetical protein AJ79_02497 [Helicocarpus griseus UAMH5409]